MAEYPKDELDKSLDEVSRKNLGQLLSTLEEMNCSQGVLAVVKMVFWKNLDEIKEKIRR